jgi:CheY-like chemotaxis protein
MQKLIITVDDDIPDSLSGDDQRFTQVLMNLLSNADKFTHEGGEITLTVALESRTDESLMLRVNVIDNGIGMTEEQQERLFRAFEQAEMNTSRKFGGTGLGLALSQKLAVLMGGIITVESELGKGSTFTYTAKFKIVNKAGSRGEEVSRSEKIYSFKGKKILIAEDIEINREIVCALLEPTEAEVVVAENGKIALDMFKESGADLILMDILMPVMDGYEATRKIRASGVLGAETVPIIAMTAKVFREDIELCTTAGMNDHIGKPINVDEMMRKIERQLGSE